MPLTRIDELLHFDGFPIPELATFAGTPVYVYSWNKIVDNVDQISRHLSGIRHQIHYAVKANSNLELLCKLAHLGIGFDIVSVGELERVLKIGGVPRKMMFSGVGKTTEEIAFAIKVGIGSINVESAEEFSKVLNLATRFRIRANVMFRVNPNVNATTHPYLATALESSKFGMCSDEIIELIASVRKAEHLNCIGLSCHLGSQISDVRNFDIALQQLQTCAETLERLGLPIKVLNLGGGFATKYRDEPPFCFKEFSNMLLTRLNNRDIEIRVEPGRFIVANAGILITRIEFLKRAYSADGTNFAIVDAAMNDLIRPALYGSWHNITAVKNRRATLTNWDIVGPICESGDFIGRDRRLALAQGDLLVVEDVGAYGFALSSNYNSRTRAAELLISPDGLQLIRKRESLSDLMWLEEHQ